MTDTLTEPFAFVIFGGSGDLSRGKLIPALYHLAALGYMPEKYAVVGVSRTPMNDDAFREYARDAIEEHRAGEETAGPSSDELLRSVYYQAGDNTKPESFTELKRRLDALDMQLQLRGNRLFYLAVAPDLAPVIVQNLDAAGMLHHSQSSWVRVVFEKPFGHDLESARTLNATIQRVLSEEQIYRIDHYLGKETVQNILTFRFGNSIFEPLFNRTQVHTIRITVAETAGMDGRRGAYYDSAGALRDMVQNHVLQLLCLIAMEPPAAFDAESIRDEKVKVLRALPAMTTSDVSASTVRGQYRGYRNEPGVDPGSMTETYVALRTSIENWRWSGVPILIQTGKRLGRRLTDIEIEFNQPPLCLFREFSDCPPNPNSLVMRIQPNEGISLSFVCKQPGTRFAVQDVKMDFAYGGTFPQRVPEAYERLLLDALRGDASLFTRSDEVELAWQFVSAIREGWSRLPEPVFPNYEPGTQGPAEASRLLNPTQTRRQ
ncbi:MAG: glucose-6-phosphate dehydrogenase [Acidobacteria bacterium]|nr:MAG: glucose-6-phosphate dehydrogenase [Acidobacteriota bacterium]